MGTDIHIHIEYQRRKKGKKPRWIHSGEDFIPDRLYSVFGILAGLRSVIKPIVPPRGLPDDITLETYRHYKDYEGEEHTASWLTTEEFGECLDVVDSVVRAQEPDVSGDWLKNYRLIHKYMKDSDDEGEPARIIFWFDN